MTIRIHLAALCCTALLVPVAGLTEEAAAAAKTPAKQETAAKEDAEAKKEKPAKTPCAQTTGSRIRPSRGRDCAPSTSAARTYSEEQLHNTGRIDTVEALRQLDPAVR